MNMNPFEYAIVLDLANNHYGDVDHAAKTIDELRVELNWYFNQPHPWDIYLKLQYRQLASFIHPDFRDATEPKHIKRFLETELNYNELGQILNYAKKQGFKTMVTPFDEKSVQYMIDHAADAAKIASCSALEFPLVSDVADTGLPVSVSTGGCQMENIDDLVSLLEHKNATYCLNHCVSIYPTKPDDMQLCVIQMLKERYPKAIIGWSTHENPDDLIPGVMAFALGARYFERHVGFPYKDQPLNAYSSSPEQIRLWLDALTSAHVYYGDYEGPETVHLYGKPCNLAKEEASIKTLYRGLYANDDLEPGEYWVRDQREFMKAMPCLEGQQSGNYLTDSLTLLNPVKEGDPIMEKDVVIHRSPSQPIKDVIHHLKAMLNYARIELPVEFETEFSHHNGMENFKEVGVTMITLLNRYYAKKLLLMAPGQHHPEHHHKLKEESFNILWGELLLKVDGKQMCLGKGDVLTVMPGMWHSFWTNSGCIFEEISTTAISGDSVYRESRIAEMVEAERKTRVKGWGRWELEL